MFNRIPRAAAVIALTACLAAPSAAQTDYRALITDLSGSILVARADHADYTSAIWGMQLFAGDRVKTERGSKVSLLFSDNSLIELGANSALTISEGPGAVAHSSARSLEEDLYGTLASLKQRSNAHGRALAGLRAGESDSPTTLISPRNTKVKELRPSFAWQPEKEYDGFVIKLYDASGLVWSRQAETNRLDYPEDEASLVPGRSYFWEVEGQSLLDAESSEKAGFSVLSEEELARVAERESAIELSLAGEENSTNYQFAVGAFYAREGLVESAIASFEEIAERHPHAVLPHEILGRLYEEIGLEDLAVAELEEAVALGRQN